MNHILTHTLATQAAKRISGYAASPLRKIASPLRPSGVQL